MAELIYKEVETKIQYSRKAVDNLERFKLNTKERIESLEKGIFGNSSHIVKNSPFVFITRSIDKNESVSGELLAHKSPQGEIFNRYLLNLGVEKNDISILPMMYTEYKKEYLWGNILSQTSLKYYEFRYINHYQVIFLMCIDSMRWALGYNYDSIKQLLGGVYKSTIPKGLLGNKKDKEVVFIPIPHPTKVLFDTEMRWKTLSILSQIHDKYTKVLYKEPLFNYSSLKNLF